MSTPTRSPRAASIRDVARIAGVSHQTVSRVLNNHVSIRDETRDRVLAAMAELQYRPSAAARALSTSRSKTIGVLASTRAQYGPARSIQAIEQAARERGWFVTSSSVAEPDEASLRDALANLFDQDIEALVVIAPQQRVFDTIADLAPRVPYITLRALGPGDPSALRVDEIAGARTATRHLVDLGHRSIGHLAGPRDWIEAEARMQGFLQELNAQDLPVTVPVLGDWTADFGYRAGLQLLGWRDVTAWFCSNDAMAIGLMHAARDLGLDVPGDLSIVGYDDVPEAAHLWPPLTTVRQDFAEMGRRCITTLLGEEPPATPMLPELVLRGSTAAPRS
ncbi:LacI family DNA-binding transcriptional regulator [Amnibacterium kyonggiense]|uniref:LacI family transcriptional regulator n=1 Tax=Amnibacterium kyonggiense TaxID=595671 RepID=A0A4R7FSN2_9MICO|nr:LacI family DNA-binding transcriptional regulator [Amnibacterium kyonggiense]TDS80679.1 LacI family transcriptional regulator [Amnibacterium kyonggiense]